MIVYDSSVWIALLNTDDSCHERACKQFQNDIATKNTFLIPECVFMEVVTVLRRIATAKHASAFMRLTAEENTLTLTQQDQQTTRIVCAMVLHNTHPKLSFVDLYLLTLSHTHNIVTYDKVLAKALDKK